MRAVIQRVCNATISTDTGHRAAIGRGIVILLGIEEHDTSEDVQWLSGKIFRMRIFPDNTGMMNLSVGDIQGDIMVVSQFTLHASTKKGNRPSYVKAAGPMEAIPLYNQFIETMNLLSGNSVATGEFGAMMEISLVNSGPVTIIIDSKNRE